MVRSSFLFVGSPASTHSRTDTRPPLSESRVWFVFVSLFPDGNVADAHSLCVLGCGITETAAEGIVSFWLMLLSRALTVYVYLSPYVNP